MVSWWGSTTLDELTEKATSELLPAGQEDQALQFEISDLIRSQKVKPKEAVQSLRKRLEHKNPNVVLATLSLADVCVKNGGDPFVRAVASREFMEDMMSLMDRHKEVRDRSLTLIQLWGMALKDRPEFSVITDTYLLLKGRGVHFPPLAETALPNFLETATAPEWTDSDVCERCRVTFTFTNRKHHCRHCGRTFCQLCSSKNLPLPHLAIHEEVRVCDGCYTRLKLAKVAKKDSLPAIYGTAAPPMPAFVRSALAESTWPHSPSSRASSEPRKPKAVEPASDTYEDDLKKAIELSLKEQPQTKKDNSEEHDPDLEAAIQASLQQMSISSMPPPATRSDSLTSTEMDSIALFSTLVERIRNLSDDSAYVQEVDSLYANVGVLQPKLIKNLDEANRKHRQFAELHENLNKAVRKYDRLLEERLAITYQRPVEKDTRQPYYQTMPDPSPYQAVDPSPAVAYADAYPQIQQPESYAAHMTSYYPPPVSIPPASQNTYNPQPITLGPSISEGRNYTPTEAVYQPTEVYEYPPTMQHPVSTQHSGQVETTHYPQHSQQHDGYYYTPTQAQPAHHESELPVQPSPLAQHPSQQYQEPPVSHYHQPAQPYSTQPQESQQSHQPYETQYPQQPYPGQPPQQSYPMQQPQQPPQYQTYSAPVKEAPLIDL